MSLTMPITIMLITITILGFVFAGALLYGFSILTDSNIPAGCSKSMGIIKSYSLGTSTTGGGQNYNIILEHGEEITLNGFEPEIAIGASVLKCSGSYEVKQLTTSENSARVFKNEELKGTWS